MSVNLRIIILGSFVAILLGLLIFRSCERPPQKGKKLYAENCASCHGFQGEGFRNLIPPLNDSVFLQENKEEFACIIAYGLDKSITVNGTTYNSPMEGFANLNAIEIANIANYVYANWGGEISEKFTSQDIEKTLLNCE